jgi:hypothetical protein
MGSERSVDSLVASGSARRTPHFVLVFRSCQRACSRWLSCALLCTYALELSKIRFQPFANRCERSVLFPDKVASLGLMTCVLALAFTSWWGLVARAHVTCPATRLSFIIAKLRQRSYLQKSMRVAWLSWKSAQLQLMRKSPSKVFYGGLHNRGACVRSGVCGPLAD